MNSNGWLVVEASDEELIKFYPNQESFFYSIRGIEGVEKGTDFIDTALKNMGWQLEIQFSVNGSQRRLYSYSGDFIMILKQMYDLTHRIHEARIKVYGVGVNTIEHESSESYEVIYVDTTGGRIKSNMIYSKEQLSDGEINCIRKISDKLISKEKTMLALSGAVTNDTFNKIEKFINKEGIK